jgi:hypothetical protein
MRRLPETEMAFACAETLSAKWASKCNAGFREFLSGFRRYVRLFLRLKGISDVRETFPYSSVAGPEYLSMMHGIYMKAHAKSLIQKTGNWRVHSRCNVH